MILNDPPYGSERVYLALVVLKKDSAVTVFLMADAVAAARQGQKTPDSCSVEPAWTPVA